MPKVLAMLALDGTIVTAEALNCQRDIAQQIIDQGGNYVLALKDIQATLFDDVKIFLDDPQASVSVATEVDGGPRPGIEDRSAVISTDIHWLQERHHWPGLKAIGKVTASLRVESEEGSVTEFILVLPRHPGSSREPVT